jgi:hypothetical protein
MINYKTKLFIFVLTICIFTSLLIKENQKKKNQTTETINTQISTNTPKIIEEKKQEEITNKTIQNDKIIVKEEPIENYSKPTNNIQDVIPINTASLDNSKTLESKPLNNIKNIKLVFSCINS